jgi:hypothetical protein
MYNRLEALRTEDRKQRTEDRHLTSDTNCDYDLRFCHFDWRATEWPVVEKSIKKRFLDSASLRSK